MMALISRVSRLFTADVHAVLDRLEEPDMLLRQAVREMDEEVSRNERRLESVRAELKQLERARADGLALLDELNGELDICFDAGQEDLARSLIRRKLMESRRVKAIAKRIDVAAETIAGLEDTLAEQRARLAEMQQNAELLAAGGGDHGVGNEFTVSDDDVEVALLREKQNRGRS